MNNQDEGILQELEDNRLQKIREHESDKGILQELEENNLQKIN